MEWTRSETLALAFSKCSTCHGLGLIIGRRGKPNACNCVLRSIFRICYERFRECVTKEKYMTRVSLHFTRGTDRRLSWGRKDEEYMADFVLIAKRTLTEEEYRIFKYHYLLGAGWKLCARKFKMDRGNFFHTLYRIQRKLGRVYRELKPYSLYPVNEYFSTTINSAEPIQMPIRPANNPHPVQPPLKRAA